MPLHSLLTPHPRPPAFALIGVMVIDPPGFFRNAAPLYFLAGATEARNFFREAATRLCLERLEAFALRWVLVIRRDGLDDPVFTTFTAPSMPACLLASRICRAIS